MPDPQPEQELAGGRQEGATGSRSTASKPLAKPFQIAAKASKNNGIVIVTHTHTERQRGIERERMKGRLSVTETERRAATIYLQSSTEG